MHLYIQVGQVGYARSERGLLCLSLSPQQARSFSAAPPKSPVRALASFMLVDARLH